MACGPRCYHADTPRSSCRCSCGGARHGQGNVPAGTPTDTAGRPAADPDGSRTNLGVTPYRGQPRETREAIDAYYETTRYKSFERARDAAAAEHGVAVESATHVDGLWEGDAEPASSVWLRGDPAAADAVAAELGRRFNQDGVFTFRPDPDGDGVLYTLPGVRDIQHARTLLARYGITAARLNGHDLEIASPDESLDEAVSGIAHELGVRPAHEYGRVAILDRESYG